MVTQKFVGEHCSSREIVKLTERYGSTATMVVFSFLDEFVHYCIVCSLPCQPLLLITRKSSFE
jgi:hypothetical protein